MDAQQIISIIIFVVTMAAIMTEKVHRALAAVAGATLLLVCQILDVESLASYIDFNTVGILIGMMLFCVSSKKFPACLNTSLLKQPNYQKVSLG